MSAGCTYTINFRAVSISAVQDVCAAYAGASMAIKIVSVTLGQITQTSVEERAISIKRLPATVTAGSSGSAMTPTPDTDADPASTFTAQLLIGAEGEAARRDATSTRNPGPCRTGNRDHPLL